MKRYFDCLYYCLYRVFASIERNSAKDEILASFMYSLLLYFNGLTILMVIGNFVSFEIIHLLSPFWSVLLIALLLPISYLFCRYYFIIKQNFKRIILEKEMNGKRYKNFFLIGILYTALTYVFFLITVLYLSN